MTEALEHMLDHKKAVDESGRVLKKGGYFVVTVPNRDWASYDFYKDYIDAGEFQPVQDHYFRVKELEELLSKSGFKILKLKGTDKLILLWLEAQIHRTGGSFVYAVPV